MRSEKDNHGFDKSPLNKISPAPYKKSPHYRIASQKKSPPADNLPVKIHPARAVAERGGFLPVNCRSGQDFSARRSYNGTPMGGGS